MLTQLFTVAIALGTVTASPYSVPYFGKYFHGQRTSNDSSSEGNIYPVKDCSAFIANTPNSWSCHNTSVITDECCFENYGILLQSQFWDYNTTLLDIAVNGTTQEVLEAELRAQIGSLDDDLKKTFTIHGLWNDLCNGSYNQYCQPSLEVNNTIDNLTHLIGDQFKETQLLKIMKKYWINTLKSNVDDQASASLWEHEYNKHGTCMNTLNPPCFNGNYTKFENTVNFYKKTVEVWSQLDTYEFLAAAGIYPTTTRQYKLADIEKALAEAHGGSVFVGCLDGAIDEIWYYYNLQGNVLTGTYRPIDQTGKSTCKDKVWYIPK
ncbi:RBT7 [Candida pseudojiufengensis]|uniref:RBT7 n=1 Tax=Candida pseudojiufengensis TaxID=497109 RepID=UPI00222574EC|nr:RBT7 [Candida pseudojiufengensis]KAI5965576.1 RBT7 [Candida pseudojiufengensis]